MFDISQTPGKVLSFWYHMYGISMGELEVFIIELDTINGDTTELISIAGDQGNLWQLAVFDLDSLGVSGDFLIEFHGTTGPSYQSDIAIDNIRIGDPIVVTYNALTNNMLIGVSEGSLIFKAGEEIPYTFEKCSPNKLMWNQYTKWGLPNYMGFNKATYDTFDIDLNNIPLQAVTNPPLTDVCGNLISNHFISNLNGLIIYSNADTNWISASGPGALPFYNQSSAPQGNLNLVIAYPNRIVSILNSPNNVNLMGEDCIYMELEKYNNINEIYPFSERSNTLYNCDFGSKSDSAFAIIPLTQTPFGSELGNRTSFNTNAFFSEPPIKNVNRLEFKFRYHDGRLVDFKNLPFSFVLEFNMLREEQARNKVIRIPHLY